MKTLSEHCSQTPILELGKIIIRPLDEKSFFIEGSDGGTQISNEDLEMEIDNLVSKYI